MKKPLLTAKEYDELKNFAVDNLSLVPKLVNINVYVTKTTDSVESESINQGILLGQLKSSKVLNKDQSTSKPIYYYDFSVKVPEDFDFKYQPGDSFGFYPKLSQEEVEFLAEKLQVSLDDLIKISGPIEILSAFFPSYNRSNALVIKTSEFLSRLDIKGFPKKATLRTLAEYCQDEKEANILLFLSSRNGSDAYNRLRTELLSVQMLLAAFDSLKPTLEVMASVVGPLQPRYFSCCRKQQQQDAQDDSSFQIVFNVTESSPESSPEFKVKGVCSSWLESLKPESEFLPIQQRSISHFRLPEPLPSDCPIIMIAAGTGVAPFIGFLETLKYQNSKLFTWLIFGFRSLQDDFIFQDELESFKAEGTLSRLSLAVSRDPVEPKTYVQDIIRKEKEEFFKLLNNAIIYVCGDELKMIKGVNDAIVELILENNLEMSQKEAEALLMKWTKEKKIIRDIWV